MSWQIFIMYMVVAGIGIPAAIARNVTALALIVAWAIGEFHWFDTGDSLPIGVWFKTDIMVLVVLYAKTTCRIGPKRYPTLGRQLYCLLADLTPYDRLIVAIFLLGVWPTYVLMIDPWTKWHILWVLTIMQFMLAGAEAVASLIRHVRQRATSDPPGDGLALAGMFRGYG